MTGGVDKLIAQARDEEVHELRIGRMSDALGAIPLARYDDVTKLAEIAWSDVLRQRDALADALVAAEARADEAAKERDEAMGVVVGGISAVQQVLIERRRAEAAEAREKQLLDALAAIIAANYDTSGEDVAHKQALWTAIADGEVVWRAAGGENPPDGYIVPAGDERCGFVMDACQCMKRKGHDGLHGCAHGGWRAGGENPADSKERT